MGVFKEDTRRLENGSYKCHTTELQAPQIVRGNLLINLMQPNYKPPRTPQRWESPALSALSEHFSPETLLLWCAAEL